MIETAFDPLPRRSVVAGLAASGAAALMSPTTVLGQANAGRALILAANNGSRFAGVRFGGRLILQSGSGPVRIRGLMGISKMSASGAENARRMRFDSPTDMRGVSTLTIERTTSTDDLWIFLPSLGRVRRLVSSNRRDAWVGSAFSFGDILGHKVDDWNHVVEGREAIDGVACTRIASLPIQPQVGRDTGYSKRVSWVRNTDRLLARSDFYDLTGKRFKQLNQTDFRPVDAGRLQPFRIMMSSVDGTTASLLQFDNFRVDPAISPQDVAPEALRS
jgi:uncharacterized protein